MKKLLWAKSVRDTIFQFGQRVPSLDCVGDRKKQSLKELFN